MYPPLHSALGKPNARDALSGGFLLPRSGLLRLFGALCAILAVTLLLDAAALAPHGIEGSIAASDVQTKEGN
jgi:hypothetical protein